MSDNDDYMSASFSKVTEDIRPGLIKSNTTKRKIEIERKAQESNKRYRTKPLRQLEEEHRNAGLSSAITSDNKGFAMLQKMGYKPGMKLGRQKDETSGLKEPIKIQVKADRGGLGREEQIRQKIKEKEQKKAEIKVWKTHETERLTEEFRQRMRDRVLYKHLKSDLNKLQKACEQLDDKEGIQEPMRPWFWFTAPDHEGDEDEDFEDEEALDPEDQLHFINDYLRSKYFYCVWCGTKYDDENDMQSNCPGIEKDDHE